MVKVCVYGPCTKTTKNDPELKFVSFVKPWKDSERAEKWKILCGREDLKITKNTWICSLHFPQNEILDPTRNQNLEPFQAPPNSTRIRLSDKYHQIPRFIPVDHDVLHGTKKCLDSKDEMGKNCCYGPCTVSTYNNPEVRWCPFVKPWWSIERCEEWKALCDREDLLVSFDTWICERHFPPGADLNPKKNLDLKPFKAPPGSRRERRTKPNPVNYGDEFHQNQQRTKPNPVNYGDEFHLNLEEFHKNAPKRSYHKSFGNDADSFVNCEIVKKEPLTEEETAKNTENSIIVIKKEDLTDKTTYLKTKIRILEAQLETERKYKDPLSDLSLLLSKVETLEMKLAEEKKKSDQLTSQNASLKVENAKLKQLKEPKGGIVKSVLEKHFSEAQIQCILHNDFDLSVSWSKLDLINAAQIFAYSKDAYEHLKQKRMIPLPDTNEVEGFLKYGSFRNKIQGIQHFNLILDLQPKKKKPPSTQIKEEQCQLEIDAYSKRDYEIDFKI